MCVCVVFFFRGLSREGSDLISPVTFKADVKGTGPPSEVLFPSDLALPRGVGEAIQGTKSG